MIRWWSKPIGKWNRSLDSFLVFVRIQTLYIVDIYNTKRCIFITRLQEFGKGTKIRKIKHKVGNPISGKSQKSTIYPPTFWRLATQVCRSSMCYLSRQLIERTRWLLTLIFQWTFWKKILVITFTCNPQLVK